MPFHRPLLIGAAAKNRIVQYAEGLFGQWTAHRVIWICHKRPKHIPLKGAVSAACRIQLGIPRENIERATWESKLITTRMETDITGQRI